MTKVRIGWIGTGLMGSRMAGNLLRAGFPLSVWNRTQEKVQPLLDQGATWVTSPAELAAGAEVLMTSLTDGAAVGDVLLRHGVATSLRRGTLMIDLSSIAPLIAREHAALLTKVGVAHLDAPVSGGTRGAAAATLAIMVGGAAADVERAKPILSTLGRPTHVGPSGAGQIAKLANQVIVGVTLGAVAEALTLAARAGADPAAVRTALSGGFADSRILQEHGARMLAGDFVPGGTVKNQLKDLKTAIALADESHLELPLLHATRAQFQAIADTLGDQLDHSAIFKLLMDRSANPQS
ncbi:MAG TPA: NAD(P)-dependent oxidoreductase [Planctomycetota bacterium]|jgi:2-hydroxy-3-oxopropionate reductase|nr:NAD(P)-dependent oxidoreductase [Planctomycetota bacterium]